MSSQEFNVRLVVIDNATVVMMNGSHPQILDDKRAKQALRFLGLQKDAVPVPERSFELAKRAGQDNPDGRLVGAALQIMSMLAEYKEPLNVRQISELITMNMGTLSGKLSLLKKRGLLVATGYPSQYMVADKGHAALIAAAKP